MPDEKPHSLKKSEWIFALVVLSFLFTSWIVAKKTSYKSFERLAQIEQTAPLTKIVIDVSGCVSKPGKVEVRPGSCVRTVLRKARVKPLADLSTIDLKQKVVQNGTLFVPELKEICVEVIGCVEVSAPIIMPAKSRICDLKDRLALSKDADLAFFKRRRMLRNNEVIEIPSKKDGKRSKRLE